MEIDDHQKQKSSLSGSLWYSPISALFWKQAFEVFGEEFKIVHNWKESE